MSFNRVTAPSALEAFFKSLLGTPYSEDSPPGSDADGHFWVPSEGRPNHLDCSGAMHYVYYEVLGVVLINDGNAAMQWGQHPSLRVGAPIQLADALYFRGATGTQSSPGHTGMALTYAANGTGLYISAYDKADSLCIKPYSIHGGPDGYVGAVRIVNLLASPPPPKPPAPKPKPIPAPKENPAAHAYALKEGMVQIDHAEASMAAQNHPHINWYVWKNNAMIPEPINLTKETDVIYAYANVLNAAGIPHAGA